MRPIIFIIGVSGCGKSTVGRLLAEYIDSYFVDADDFHPKSNIEKMESGSPLTDADREEWLLNLNLYARKHRQFRGLIVACSALKEAYRLILKHDIEEQVKWVFLKGDISTIQKRLESRTNHFMPSNLLQSQFDTLEIPDYGLHLNISKPPESLVKNIIKEFNL